MDILYIGIGIVFFVATYGLLILCDRLSVDTSKERP